MEQKMHDVKIHEKEQVWDVATSRVTKTLRHKRFNDETAGTSKLVAVLKAYNNCKAKIKDLDMIEVSVDGSSFQG